jgi:hypothetical protein
VGTYAMLARLSQGAVKNPESVTRSDKQTEDRTKKDCPGVKWLTNSAVLGPYDYIFEGADTDTATKSHY